MTRYLIHCGEVQPWRVVAVWELPDEPGYLEVLELANCRKCGTTRASGKRVVQTTGQDVGCQNSGAAAS